MTKKLYSKHDTRRKEEVSIHYVNAQADGEGEDIKKIEEEQLTELLYEQIDLLPLKKRGLPAKAEDIG